MASTRTRFNLKFFVACSKKIYTLAKLNCTFFSPETLTPCELFLLKEVKSSADRKMIKLQTFEKIVSAKTRVFQPKCCRFTHTHYLVFRKSLSRSYHRLRIERFLLWLRNFATMRLFFSLFLKIIEIEEDGKMTILVQVRCFFRRHFF